LHSTNTENKGIKFPFFLYFFNLKDLTSHSLNYCTSFYPNVSVSFHDQSLLHFYGGNLHFVLLTINMCYAFLLPACRLQSLIPILSVKCPALCWFKSSFHSRKRIFNYFSEYTAACCLECPLLS
jgi:hypothetical protein